VTDEAPPLRTWSRTDVGRVRDHNEDNFLDEPVLGLFAVADGMGGHAAGEVASQMALDSVKEVVTAGQAVVAAYRAEPNRQTRRDVLRVLEQAGRAACEAVHAEGQRDKSKRGMGTTLCAALIVGRHAFIGHVGDSRMYLVRKGKAHQLTQDHSLRNELLKRGRLSAQQVEAVPQKEALTRAIGVYASVDVDTLDLELAPGDRLLICSDGLSGYVESDELPPLVQQPEHACQRLIDLANERGGRDNITAVLVVVPEAQGGEEVRLRLPIDALRSMPLFRYLNYQELVRLAAFAEVRDVVADEPIFRQGEPGHEMYVVLEGRVKVHAGGKEIVSLGVGEQFGEMALVDKSPRSASVTATEGTRLVVIKRDDFFHIMRHERDMAVKLLWHFVGTLTGRLRETTGALGQARDALDLSAELFVELDE